MSASQPLPWTRVLIEGVVIVASILLALAADAGWDARQERQLEVRYYARLSADLAEDSAIIERILHFNRVNRRSAIQLIATAEEGAPAPDELTEVAHLVAWAGYVAPQTLESASFDDMVSAGRLGLISDPDMSQSLLQYYRLGEVRAAHFERAPTDFPEWSRRTLPAGFTRAAQHCLWAEWPGLGGYGMSNCRAEIIPTEVRRVISELRSDSNVVGYLREAVWFADDLESAFTSQQTLNTRLRERMRATLGS